MLRRVMSCFLSRGLMAACFSSNGTDQLLNDSLVMLVMTGIRTDACCLMNDVGMVSRLHVAALTIQRISPSSAGRNAEHRGNGSMSYTSAWSVCKLFQIFFNIFTDEITHPRSYLGIGATRWQSSDVCPVKSLSIILKSAF